MYSQNNEQEIILRYFADKEIPISQLKCLDIGYYDGKKFSNTYALAQLNAEIIGVQPSPDVLRLARMNMAQFPNVSIIPYAIAKQAGMITFYSSSTDAIGSTELKHTKKWSKAKFKEIQVQAITVQDLFNKSGKDFDFISLDVQSANIEIFRDINFKELTKLKLFVIEHDNNQKEIEETLKPLGFKLLLENGENVIYGR